MSEADAMSEYGVITEAGSVRFERLLPGPIERVWAYLTESDKRATWLASGPMQLSVGGRVELFFRHADLSATVEPTPERYCRFENGVGLEGRITRCEPPRLLAHTWGGEAGDSEVTYDLSEVGDKVRLVLTHRRLGDRGMLISVAGGWHTHLAILADRLAGREPPPFWSAHARLAAEYEALLPAA